MGIDIDKGDPVAFICSDTLQTDGRKSFLKRPLLQSSIRTQQTARMISCGITQLLLIVVNFFKLSVHYVIFFS
ncbi:Uncharacterised protein [Vibrio cholerae]|uniref:Uncharacterized protein n=1 Tax=Vibrio cholerae TaxID=666 RepID=A0A655YLI0_VIBCL|nr:Uncharacterised protein [Vibrio cholerae]